MGKHSRDPHLMLRLAQADRYFPKLHRAYKETLNNQIRDCARRARKGVSPIPQGAAHLWANEIQKATLGIIHKIANDGWDLAKKELKRVKGKSVVKVGAQNVDFLLFGDQVNIKDWVKTTAESASKTTAQRMIRLYNAAIADGDTPTELADTLLSEGIAQNTARATLLARTGTIWAMNEGAEQRYIAEGVQVEEWVATEDDLTCPFCQAMDGVRVRTKDPFVPKGTEFTIKVGKNELTLSDSMPFNIDHPPLHPHCRCTIIPVFEENA